MLPDSTRPLAALTAWQALVDIAHLQEGQRVLIHAAAGGVGHLTVQIAKARGAYVVGTATMRDFVPFRHTSMLVAQVDAGQVAEGRLPMGFPVTAHMTQEVDA